MRPIRDWAGAALAAGLCLAVLVPITADATAASEPGNADAAFVEILERSLAEKKSVVLYLEGHAIPGLVIRLVGDDAVEVRNQEHARIVVRLREVVALGTS